MYMSKINLDPDVRDLVNDLDLDEITNKVYQMEKRMGLDKNTHYDRWPLGMPFYFWNGSPEPNWNLSQAKMQEIFKNYQDTMEKLGAILTRVSSMDWDEVPTEPVCVGGAEFSWTLRDRVCRMIEAYDDSYEILYRYVRSGQRMSNPRWCAEDGMSTCFRVTTLRGDEEDGKTKLNTFQKLIIILLNKLQRLKMKRYRNLCMQQVLTNDGKETHAWSPAPVKNENGAPMTIDKFIHQATPKESQQDLWRMMTSKSSMARELTDHLTTSVDVQFPDVRKNRNMWSFENGILMGREMKWIPYDSEECGKLSQTVASAKYFPISFDPEWFSMDWYDIPTPNIQHILDYQKFDRSISEWMYAFLGRLCFDVNDLDGWQVIPFLKGLAGTGKSTVVTKVAKHFYDAEDVKTMSNNIEKKFGLSSIMDAYMFLAPEVKGDIALDQAEFQSCISGEDVSVAVKNKQARSGNWKVPGMMAGNEVPGWRDNSGSILRRIVTFEFGTFVDNDKVDTQLGKKLENECGIILVKSLMAYHAKIKEVGRRDVWDALPQYFLDIQKKMSQSTSPVQNFLDSEKIKFARDLKIPRSIFVQHFKAHCSENSLGTHKVSDDLFAGPFCTKGIYFQRQGETSYNGDMFAPQIWVVGCDVVEQGQQNFC